VQYCLSAEVDNDVVLPSNSTVLLNCSLPRNGTVTWFHNDEKIEVTDDNDKVKDGNLQIDVGALTVLLLCVRAYV